MGKYRKKPVVVEAVQWWRMGDHPAVENDYDGKMCPICHCFGHGKIETLEGTRRVCPGDWIIMGEVDEHYPCNPDVFEKTYEPVEVEP